MKEMSAERRALVAAVLSLLVIVGWSLLVRQPVPPKPAQPAGQQAEEQAPGQTPGPAALPAPPRQPEATPAKPAAPAVIPLLADTAERTIVVENGLYRVVFSNHGAIIQSWQLKNYEDDHSPPRTLDVVNPEAAKQLGGWPFSLTLDDPKLQSEANSALYVVTPVSETLEAPTEIAFEWSDGHLAVTKRVKFERGSYIVHIETSVELDGKPLSHGLAWRGGFGDSTVYMPYQQMQVFASTGGKTEFLNYKKLGAPGQPAVRKQLTGSAEYAGIEDHYFAAAFMPPLPEAGQQAPPPALAVWDWATEREAASEGKTEKQQVPEVSVGTDQPGKLVMRAYVGPKNLDDLKAMRPPLDALVQFGWFGAIAKPLFYVLKWFHRYVPNYGWAIVLLTLAINTVLFPLQVKSRRSMLRMQKVQPEVKAIQERYKKYSMRDPRKQEMNKEIMAVYQREGVNPMGGCLPMVLQLPIWYALFEMLRSTIELRHAPWIGWIRDLSAKDPYYILPVLMAVAMYISTKMTPTPTADPTQKKMMALMPVMFGGMFIVFPISSGLVLYILTQNLVSMGQQWYLNRSMPPPVPAKGAKRKKA